MPALDGTGSPEISDMSRPTQALPTEASDMPPVRSFKRPVELLLYAVSPLATLITAPLLARSLGVEGRGYYGVALTVVGFALMLSAWGQSETLLTEARRGHDYYHAQARLTLGGGLIAMCLCLPA